MGDKILELDEKITDKYDIKKRLGKGAYGVVWKAIHKKTGDTVAVKKIFDAFRNKTDAQRTFREIMFLQDFGSHPNVIQLLNVHRAKNNQDIYLVFEYMETDLYHVIKKKNILQDIHKRFIMYQLFKAIKYIHSGNVVHRDAKPSNILLDRYCRCKLADFGLARSLSLDMALPDAQGDPALTDYVATRWYRAPEILLACKRYTKGVDMWSLGCIIGEMLLGEPLFPGSSTLDQLEKIMTIIPMPSREDMEIVRSKYTQVLEKAASKHQYRPLEDMLPEAPTDARNLLQQLLIFNPHKRLNADEALRHAYVSRFHKAHDEPVMNHEVTPPLSDNVQLSVGEYQKKLYELIDKKSKNRHCSVHGIRARKSHHRRKSMDSPNQQDEEKHNLARFSSHELLSGGKGMSRGPSSEGIPTADIGSRDGPDESTMGARPRAHQRSADLSGSSHSRRRFRSPSKERIASENTSGVIGGSTGASKRTSSPLSGPPRSSSSSSSTLHGPVLGSSPSQSSTSHHQPLFKPVLLHNAMTHGNRAL